MNLKDVTDEILKLKNKSKLSSGNKILENLFDEGTMKELNPFFRSDIAESGIICGFGTVKGRDVYAFAHSIDVNGGAMSESQALKLSDLYSMALKSGYPIVGIYNSKGAALNEGNKLMSAYGEVIKKCGRLSGVVPQISIINGMCFGAMASVASCADLVIMTKDSQMSIDISGEDSNVDDCINDGVVHIVADDETSALNCAKELVSILPSNNLCQCPTFPFDQKEREPNAENVNAREYIKYMCDEGSFIELQKGYGLHFITGLALLKGRTIGIVSSNKEISTEADYDSCSKVAGFIMFCNSYSIPIITLVDTEKVTSLKGATKLACSYSNSTTVKLAIIMGNVYATSYTILCGRGMQDEVFALESSKICMIDPYSAVEILEKEELKGDGVNFKRHRENLVEKYIKEQASALKACQDGIVNDIINANDIRERVWLALDMLSNKRQVNLPKKNANIKI